MGEERKFDATEKSVLEFLYTHPVDGVSYWGTFELLQELRQHNEPPSAEEQKKNFSEIQYAIETLIAAKLVKGKRLRAGISGEIYFSELELTTSGEVAGIQQKRRAKIERELKC